jgi:uncharacterized membrane protein
MSKEIRWLWRESSQWEAKGLITPEQGKQIRGLYPEPAAALPWSTIIFSGLGALIAGLGVILLIAYNWQALHKFAKLGIILGGIAALHGTGLRLFLRTERWRQLGEGVCLLGTMLFGAGIWLVAQVYHIEEHFPNGFFLWGLGALALAWAMPSVAQGLLAVVALTIWGASEGWGFDKALHWAPVLILVGAGLLAWRLRSLSLLCATLAGFAVSVSANLSAVEGGLVLRVLLDWAVIFVAVSILIKDSSVFPESSGVWGFFGWCGFLSCLYLLSFAGITEDLLGWKSHGAETPSVLAVVYGWVPLATVVALWAAVVWRARTPTPAGMGPWSSIPPDSGGSVSSPSLTDEERAGVRGRSTPTGDRAYNLEQWLLPLTAILCQILAMSRLTLDKWTPAGAFNLVFLAVAGAWMAKGCREGLVRPLLLGSVLLGALVTARYFDLFESLAVRGAIFLAVGGLFFTEGALFRRARKRISTTEVQV